MTYIPAPPPPPLGAKELRQKFLRNADMVFAEIQARTLGQKSPHPYAQQELLKAYWDALIPIVQSADDVQKITATSTQEVIKMLGKGKVTITEAMQLMSVLKAQVEIDHIPMLLEKLSELESNRGQKTGGDKYGLG